MSEATPADQAIFRAHQTRSLLCPCCRTQGFRLVRIEVIKDASSAFHTEGDGTPDEGAPLPPLAEGGALPLAIVLCTNCYRVETFAWLPILAASTVIEGGRARRMKPAEPGKRAPL